MLRKNLPILSVLFVLLVAIAFWSSPLAAKEVGKGQIPAGDSLSTLDFYYCEQCVD